MKLAEGVEVGSGEIVAVDGDVAARSRWMEEIAYGEAFEQSASLLSFAQHAAEAQATGWPQARYYENAGKTVDELLSYDDVWEINPFEIGAKRPETKRTFAARKEFLMRLLDLRKLRKSLVIQLSNGETRRALLARALAKGPKLLLLDDPAAGMDVKQRAKLADILTALAKRGVTILMAARHPDELPRGIRRQITVSARGQVTLGGLANRQTPLTPRVAASSCDHSRPQARKHPKPVLQIRDLHLEFGTRVLFDRFSWTVNEGEHWILRGENGSGKSTLFALITGDSPLAYASDITVFGQPRDIGCQLKKIRERIGMASPEMQAYLGRTPGELIETALNGHPDLLLLDEPFMNMEPAEAKKASRQISSYLKKNKKVTAILICHRTDEAPAIFTRELKIG